MKNNGCDESSKLWMLIYKMQKIRGLVDSCSKVYKSI